VCITYRVISHIAISYYKEYKNKEAV